MLFVWLGLSPCFLCRGGGYRLDGMFYPLYPDGIPRPYKVLLLTSNNRKYVGPRTTDILNEISTEDFEAAYDPPSSFEA